MAAWLVNTSINDLDSQFTDVIFFYNASINDLDSQFTDVNYFYMM